MNSVDGNKAIKKEDTNKLNNEEKRFVQIPPETVGLIAESVGISHVSPTISRALSEDASYRCREIVHYCGQFLRHGKRRKLTTNDFNRALRWYDANPVFGQGSETYPNFIKLPEAEIYVPDEEKLINLTNYSLSNTSHEIGEDPIIQASWLSIEGNYIPVDSEDNTPVEHPQPIQVTPALLQYYTTVTNVILGNSEEMLKVILEDLKTNSKISTLLPYFVTFVRNALEKRCDNRVITCRLLNLLQSLFSNKFLNLSPKPYLSHLVTGLLSSLIIERRGRELSEEERLYLKVDHVPLASRILRGVLDRWATPVNLLRSQTLRALREYLKDTKISYSSQYGALSALIALGPEVLEDTLLPLLSSYFSSIESKFESQRFIGKSVIAHEKEREVLINMKGRILTALRLILHYRSQNPNMNPVVVSTVAIKDEIKKEPGTAPSVSSTQTLNQVSTALSEVYKAAYEYFGDSLSIVPLCPILRNGEEPVVIPQAGSQRTKFRIRKCGEFIKPDSFISKNLDCTMKMVSKELEDPTPSDNIFSTSQNFDHLADMGVPSDIFDETSSDGFMDTSAGLSNGLNEETSDPYRIPLSPTVQNEFDTSSKYAVLRYPKISIHPEFRPWGEKLKRRSLESLREDDRIKRNCFIGRRMGSSSQSAERQKLLRKYSCSLHTTL